MGTITRALADDRAQGMTEYAILVGTIMFGAILVLTAVGSRITSIFTGVQTKLNNVPTS